MIRAKFALFIDDFKDVYACQERLLILMFMNYAFNRFCKVICKYIERFNRFADTGILILRAL